MRLNRPDTLNIVLGYRCNAQCRHCCTSCGPREDEVAARRFLGEIAVSTGACFDAFPQLSKETVTGLVDLAGETPTISRVSFTGGEPILFKPVLLSGLRRAKRYGLATRVVSNASWARTPEAARRIVSELAGAGLAQLSLSCSDYHWEFVELECLRNALGAALVTDIEVGFSIITRRGGRVSAEFLKDYLAVPEQLVERRVFFFETPVMATGRGDGLPAEDFFQEWPGANAQGRCDVAGRTPTVTPDGRLMACCGFPYREIPELDFGSIEAGLSGPMQELQQDFMVFWLRAVGPYGILRRLGLGRLPELSNVCQACRYLFLDQECRRRLEQYLESHTPEEIFREDILGMERAPGPGEPAAGRARLTAVP